MEKPEFEDAEVRDVPASDLPEGKSLVRIQEKKRWILPAIGATILLLVLLLLLLPNAEPTRGVSLEAARQVLLEEEPPLRKTDVLRILSRAGFLVTPGRPDGSLSIAVSVRREGIILRGGGRRELILWEEFPSGR